MACDISRVFHTIIVALETTDELRPIRTREKRISSTGSSQNAFTFCKRASSLRGNLTSLASYIKRVQQATGTSMGSAMKQRLQSELTEQVTQMIDQCTTLLLQLKEVSGLDDSGCALANEQKQSKQHRQLVVECLEEQLNKLRRLRDVELERQRHLRELTGSLAGGLRSVPPSKSLEPGIPAMSAFANGIQLRPRHSNRSPVNDDQLRHTDINLTDAEIQEFERENRSMYEHLSEQRDGLHLVARAISEISRLNQTLSSHLSEQLEVTQQIGENFIMSTENIRQGNELLRSALSNKASAQFWILFTMIVLTFSLHFLDWYYP